MLGPWDAPNSFDRGDSDYNDVLSSVGRVMSCWENVEFALARVYSCLCGDPDGPSVQQYGVVQVFSARLQSSAEAACRYFIAHPDQMAEGDLFELRRHALAASARRNDVAHGIVFQVDALTHFRNQIPVNLLNRPHFALIPPLYLLRKHLDGLPTFAYRSRDMAILCNRLIDLTGAIEGYRTSHFQ